MQHLAKIVGLEFDQRTDFHKEIIFTRESSKKLIAEGLHFTPAYLKNLLRAKNTFGLFQPQKASVNPLVNLPSDLMELITSFVHPNFENPRLSREDIEAVEQLVASDAHVRANR